MKLNYGDKVKVIDGFYKGLSGELVSYVKGFLEKPEYLVKVSDFKFEWIKEKHLRKVKK